MKMKQYDYEYVLFLVSQVKRLQKENDELRAARNESITTMLQGEALRNKMMLSSISNGAFDKKP